MMSDEVKIFPEALKRARKENKLSQTELSVKIGVSLMTVRRYETGESFPDMNRIGVIFLVLDRDYLIDAWANDYGIWYGLMNIPLSTFKDAARAMADEAAKRQFLVDLAQKASMNFLHRFYDIAELLLKMNETGVKKVIETMELFSKIPDYQIEESWQYMRDSTDQATHEEYSN